jgi:two-component system, sensor histidine kinase YesM
MKISNKIVVFILVIAVIPLFTMSFVFYNKMVQNIKKELNISYNQVAKQYIDKINYKIDIYSQLSDNICANGIIQQLFSFKQEIRSVEIINVSKKISKEIDMMIFGKIGKEIHNIMLYPYNEKFPSYSTHVGSIKSVRNEDWFEKIHSTNEYSNCFYYKIKGINKNIISFTKIIYNLNGDTFGERLGFVKIDIDAARFFNTDFVNEDNVSNDIFILDEKGNIMFSNNTISDKIDSRGYDYLLSQSDKTMDEEVISDGIAIYQGFPSNDWRAVFVFHYDKLQYKIRKIRKLVILIAAILLVVIIILSMIFSSTVSCRIRLLMNKMKEIENGKLETSQLIQGKDEIGVLDKYFNRMLGKLKDLINKNYVQQIERKEAELSALQSQINPHFLYNTLESINSIASVYGCFEICKISQRLGEMFHYSINIGRHEFVVLEEELIHIKNYIEIQKIRFDDKFEVFYNINEEIKQCKVLKFILQPIVENSVYHGFKDKRGKGCLKISANVEERRFKEGIMVLEVIDDGIGMEPEKLRYLNEYINGSDNNISSQYKKSIGVKNVNYRIKLTYGDSYGIRIKSKRNVGTQVILRLPAYGCIRRDGHEQHTGC